MKVIKIIILAITLLSGCAGIGNDVSTGEITAQISTRNPGCMFHYPASGHVITVDAGWQFVTQKCWGSDSFLYEVTDGQFGTPGKDRDTFRTFYFDAKAGRKYHLSGNCFKLADDDATSEDQVIDCAPRLNAGLALSSFEHRAIIIPGGRTPPHQDVCWPSVRVGWNESKRILRVSVDDGPTSIDASCDLPDPNSTSTKTASFVFNAEADHAYTLSGEDEECMRLVDITSEENVIACEPYHEESLE